MYFVEVIWYSDYDDDEKLDKVLVLASDWNGAMYKVNQEFSNICSIKMEQIQFDECNVIYLSEDESVIEKIKDANSY